MKQRVTSSRRDKTSKRDQVSQSKKKNDNTYDRQVQRNRIIFLAISVIIILSMVITSFIQY